MHALEPVVANVPAGHVVQLVEDAAVEYRPAAHKTHNEEPVAVYCPDGHDAAQLLEPAEEY